MKSTINFYPIFMSACLLTGMMACQPAKQSFTGSKGEVKLITLDPGHFHAALVQKTMFTQVDSTVFVYAPEGDEVKEHLKRIEGYNSRAENPTHWNEKVYTGADFFEKMLKDKPGNVLVLAGNNQKKTDYIKSAVEAGLNVLSDKPMAIDGKNFELLKQSFEIAKKKGVLLYDIMTERNEISTLLQKEFSQLPEVFGTLEKGTLINPAVTKESVHHYFKFVSGSALKRPAWFFDVAQQGEGIVDVTTHLVDLVQWECFPEQILDYTKDIELNNAKRWATQISPSQFNEVTKQSTYPEYLKKDLKDSLLEVYANGEINYTIKGVHAKVSVIWNFKAPEGGGDTHYSVMRGSKANLIIRQGAEQGYKPTLFIEPVSSTDTASFSKTVAKNVESLQKKYPGIGLKKNGAGWEIIIPDSYKVGHEAHFGQVAKCYLDYLVKGALPEWEVPNMLAKYYTTTKALELAKQNK